MCLFITLFIIYRSMDGGMEEDEYTSDPIIQQRRQVSEVASCFEEAVFLSRRSHYVTLP